MADGAWSQLKSAYRNLVPQEVRARAYGLVHVDQALWARWVAFLGRGAVLSGPFRGLRLPPGAPLCQLLGTYELELHQDVERLRWRGFTTVVNIGAAHGYYAAGLARVFAGARVLAFEAQQHLIADIQALALSNGLGDRLEVRGLCRPEDLAAVLHQGNALVVCDVEGAEKELLDPSRIAPLRTATVVVETHDHLAAGCEQLLRERFSATHDIVLRRAQPRTEADLPCPLPPGCAWLMPTAVNSMHEGRHATQPWLVMTPKP